MKKFMVDFDGSTGNLVLMKYNPELGKAAKGHYEVEDNAVVDSKLILDAFSVDDPYRRDRLGCYEEVQAIYDPGNGTVEFVVTVDEEVKVQFNYLGEERVVSCEEFAECYEGPNLYCVVPADTDIDDSVEFWGDDVVFIGTKKGYEKYLAENEGDFATVELNEDVDILFYCAGV